MCLSRATRLFLRLTTGCLAVSFVTAQAQSSATPQNRASDASLLFQSQTSDTPSLLSDVPAVPGIASHLRGLNVGFTFSGIHDSAAGWGSLFLPALSFRFSPRFSLDASLPVYLFRLTDSTSTAPPEGGPPAPPGRGPYIDNTQRVAVFADPGDLVLAGHAAFLGHGFSTVLTPSLTLPSGDADSGLSTGHVTFDFDVRSEHRLLNSGIFLATGIGDTSSLINRLVARHDTTLGPLAHFQAGVELPLPYRSSFQSLAYEQLPIGDSKLYTTISRPGYPDRTVVSGRGVSEDNGFTSSLNIPLHPRVIFTSYYNRSLRLHEDTVSAGFTFLLRPLPSASVRGTPAAVR